MGTPRRDAERARRRTIDRERASAMTKDGAYDHVVRGRLALKATTTTAKKAKKTKKDKREKGDRERSASGKATAKEETRTKAELAYEAHYKRAREAQMIKEMASKSHKDKVREFNEKLSKLSEHHDIPKVGPG